MENLSFNFNGELAVNPQYVPAVKATATTKARKAFYKCYLNVWANTPEEQKALEEFEQERLDLIDGDKAYVANYKEGCLSIAIFVSEGSQSDLLLMPVGAECTVYTQVRTVTDEITGEDKVYVNYRANKDEYALLRRLYPETWEDVVKEEIAKSALASGTTFTKKARAPRPSRPSFSKPKFNKPVEEPAQEPAVASNDEGFDDDQSQD